MMDARSIVRELGGRWQGSYGLARCPAHDDRTPSLKITNNRNRPDEIDVHCFAGCDWKAVKDKMQRFGWLPRFQGDHAAGTIKSDSMPPHGEALDDGAYLERLRRASKLWHDTIPLPGTLGELYFREHRGLDIRAMDLSHVLRWHARKRMIVARMTHPITNQGTGIHRTFLDDCGRKIERKMYGRRGVVRLVADEAVTSGLGLTEGIEDALSVMASGWRPVWAATSASGIKSFPVLPGIESLTIFADADAVGVDAAADCAKRWRTAGQEAAISWPGVFHGLE